MKMQSPGVPTRSESYWKEDAVSFASLYEEQFGTSLFTKIVSRFLSARTDVLLAMVGTKRYDHIADVGCGSGIHIRLLAGQTKHLTGIDYSRQMLDIARRVLSDLPKKSYDLVLADAMHLPQKSASFDLVIAMGLLDYVPSPRAVLSECGRILTKNGTLVISLPRKPSIFGLLRTGPGNLIKKYLFHLPPIDNAMDRTSVERMFLSCGLKITDIDNVWSAMWMIKAVPFVKSSGKK